MIKKNALLTLVFLALISCIQADSGYRIEVNIQGITGGETFLAYHFGDRQFIADTAQFSPEGQAFFSGEKRLDPGMYLLVLPDQGYLEFLIDHNQHFTINALKEDPISSMQFEGSPDNTAFYDYIREMREINMQKERIQQAVREAWDDEELRNQLIAGLSEAEDHIRYLQEAYIELFPDGLFSSVLRSQREPDLPEIFGPDGNIDQQAMYQAYKRAFWNRIDFSDDRLLRTPVYQAMLNRYFNQVVMQIPDSVIVEADRIVEMARASDEMFKFTIWFITNNSERSNVMGMDALFVHMVERYYMSGEAFWVEPANLERISQRAMALKPLLIGRKAPEIRAFAPDGQVISMHGVEAPLLVVYFWDSECGHCQQETPELLKLSHELRDQGLKVYAVNTEQDSTKWKGAIERYGLDWINVNDTRNRSGFRENYDIFAIPTIFLLDAEKRIIAKRLGAEQLRQFIKNHHGL